MNSALSLLPTRLSAFSISGEGKGPQLCSEQAFTWSLSQRGAVMQNRVTSRAKIGAAEVRDPRGTAGPPSRAAEGCAGWQSILQPNLVPADDWGDIRELFV